jgi:hypothetical protein
MPALSSAALRSIPAFFRASFFSGPFGIDRAASKASSASAFKSRFDGSFAMGTLESRELGLLCGEALHHLM